MNFTSRLLFVLLLGVAISLAGVALAKRAADQRIQGTHKLKIEGDFVGTGTIVVQQRSVTFSLKLKDERGNDCSGESDEIEFGDGRFYGTLQTGGISIEISGRVDLPAGNKKPRVTAFLRSSDGRVARIANSLKIADGDDEHPTSKPEEDHDSKGKPKPHPSPTPFPRPGRPK